MTDDGAQTRKITVGKKFTHIGGSSVTKVVATTMHRYVSHTVDVQDVVDPASRAMVARPPKAQVKQELPASAAGHERIICSLDYLAAIANEQAHHESGHVPDVGDEDTTCEDADYDEADLGEDPSAFEPQTAEETAATALLMASGITSYKTRIRGSRALDASEGCTQRWRRLSQNQNYRMRLRDKGFRPLRVGQKRYACSLCHETFEKEMFVWRHGVKHLDSKPFQCSICHGTFNRSDSLQRHVRNFHMKT